MKPSLYVALIRLWLACFVAGPATTYAQGSFVYQRFVNPNPNTNAPWDDSGVWVRNQFLGGSPLNLDLDLDGNVDFQIVSKGDRNLSINAIGSGQVIALRSLPPDLGSFAARLASGQQIGSLALAPYEWVETINNIPPDPIGATMLETTTAGTLGFWGGQFGYLGLRIQRNGEWHYGWIRGGVPLSIVPEGIFYEAALNLNPNAGIFAGQVPEPSTICLCGLGILILSFRRQQPASA